MARFYIGKDLPRQDKETETLELWNKLKEPGVMQMTLISMPISLLLAFTFYKSWVFLVPTLQDPKFVRGYLISWVPIALFVLTIMLHEVIHLICHPRAGATRDSVLGFMPQSAAFYAAYLGVWSCRRFLVCLIAPFIVLSVLPLLAAAMGANIPMWLIFVAIFNAFSASADLISCGLLLFQVPLKARVWNQGYLSYWQIAR